MDSGRIRRELWKSVRIVATDERWLLVGPIGAAAVYALWVGATGAALSFLAPLAGLSLELESWTGTTTALAALTGVLWLVLPAAAAAVLVDRQLRNHRGNLRLCYRLRHPAVLLVPPTILLLAAVGALVGLDGSPVALQGGVVAAAAFLVVRTAAYGYRVVAFSSPVVLRAMVFNGGVSLAATSLVGAAMATDRVDLLEAVESGLAETTGAAGLDGFLSGTVGVAGAELLAVPTLAVAVMVGPVLAYLAVQTVAGTVLRVRQPTVPRSQLRTGQRFPAFLKPGSVSGDPTTSPTRVQSTSAGSDSSAATGGSTGSAGTTDGSVGSTGSRSATTGSATTGSSEPGPGAAGTDGGSPTTAPGANSGTTPQPNGTGGDENTSDSESDGDEDAEDDAVSHTRVFTPGDDLGDVSGGGVLGGDADDGADENYRRCPACGAEYSDVTASFCPDCGARLEEA